MSARHCIAFHDPRLSSTSGGGEAVTLQLAALLLDAGYDVTVVTRRAKRSRLFEAALASHSNLRVAEINCRPPTAAPEGESYGWHALRAVDRLAPEAIDFGVACEPFYRSNRFDLVVVSFVLDAAALSADAPVLLNVFGLPPDGAVAAVERPLLGRCAAFTFASGYVERRFRELFGLSVEVELGPVVHAPVHPAFFEADRAVAPQFDACYSGRIVKRKGLHSVLQAVAWLRRSQGMSVKLAIVGDGPERPELESAATTLAVADQVSWMGAVGPEAVAGILRRSALFLYPTLEPEAFGCSPVEAMACGVPVITTNLGGTTDYVRPERNAIVCAPDNPESLATAMGRILSDRALAASLAAAGLDTARQFHPSATAARWLDVFTAVLARSERSPEPIQ